MGYSPPRVRPCPLSPVEGKALDNCISEVFGPKYIRLSKSPAAVEPFFVLKERGLQPCVDYRKLNSIIMKYPCPLPFVPSSLEQLRGASYFAKFNLSGVYNLIRIDE